MFTIVNIKSAIGIIKNKGLFSSVKIIIKAFFRKILMLFMARSDRFDYIYKNKIWGDSDGTLSGCGSSVKVTRKISKSIKKIIQEYGIKTFLDAPCGDFYWQNKYKLYDGVERYVGLDVVKSVIDSNIDNYGDNVEFFYSDICEDVIPSFDIILVRDCFIHLSHADIKKSVNNIISSRVKYVLLSTDVSINKNYPINTGDYRDLNMLLEPFYFPEPIMYLDDSYPEKPGRRIGMWDVSSLRNSITYP